MRAVTEIMVLFKQAWNARHKFIRLLWYVLHIVSRLRSVKYDASKQVVFVHVTSPIRYRYIEQILRTLKASGYSICYYIGSSSDLIRLGKLEGSLFWTPDVAITAVLPPNKNMYSLCCDDDQDRLLQYRWKKILKLEFDISKPCGSITSPVHIPFSVHDYIYRCCFQRREELLHTPKKIRLLFAGAYRGYENGPISSRLGKLERQAIVDIFRQFENTAVIASQEDLDAVLSGPRTTRYYWVDTSRFRIPPERWLEVLSYVEVFLCPPGVVTPMSYNAVESIAMGAIPLINYPEWFHPHLIDGHNCFAFADQAALVAQLHSIQGLPDDLLCRMRRNVLDYYRRFVSLESLAERLKQLDGELINLVMDVEKAEYTERIDEYSLAISEH